MTVRVLCELYGDETTNDKEKRRSIFCDILEERRDASWSQKVDGKTIFFSILSFLNSFKAEEIDHCYLWCKCKTTNNKNGVTVK